MQSIVINPQYSDSQYSITLLYNWRKKLADFCSPGPAAHLNIAYKLDGGVILSAAASEGMSSSANIQGNAGLVIERVDLIILTTRGKISGVLLIKII